MNNTFPPKFTEEKREPTFIIRALQRIGGRKQLFINMHIYVLGGGRRRVLNCLRPVSELARARPNLLYTFIDV